jgi:hypothetical protein
MIISWNPYQNKSRRSIIMNQIVKAKKKLNLKKTPNQEAYKCIIIKFFYLKKIFLTTAHQNDLKT